MPEERINNNQNDISQNNSQQDPSEQATERDYRLRRTNAIHQYPNRPLSPAGIDNSFSQTSTSFSQTSTLPDEPIESVNSQENSEENSTPNTTINGNLTAENLQSQNSQKNHNHY